MDYGQESLILHHKLKGKIEIISKVAVSTAEDLALAYTPGVASPCLEIQNDISKSYELTARGNMVAVVTDGTAVLGLGDIGPEAAMPVMEGKCVLFKEFGDVDAFPFCIRSKDVSEIVRTVELLAGGFGGVNLEDISAPRCFEIESQLKKKCDIPIFHDDQHGTAIVVTASLINALKIVNKNINDIKVVLNGPGSAGTAIIKMLIFAGVKNIIACDEHGILHKERAVDIVGHKKNLTMITNYDNISGTLIDACKDADVFVGVSIANVLKPEMIKIMKKTPIVFAMANPDPEIAYDLAMQCGIAVMGTGRSDYPNQINNVLAFPGIFRGALDVRASDINNEMKIAAAYAIAELVSEEELCADYILPLPFDKRIKDAVAAAVAKAARESGVARIL